MMYADHEHVGAQDQPCAAILFRRDGTEYQCRASWYSVLHPADQYRHWCSSLESGGDCMHFEYSEDEGGNYARMTDDALF